MIYNVKNREQWTNLSLLQCLLRKREIPLCGRFCGQVDDERWASPNPPLKGRAFVWWVMSVERWKSSPVLKSSEVTCSLVRDSAIPRFRAFIWVNIFLICYFSYNIYIFLKYIYIIAQIPKSAECGIAEKWNPQDFYVTAW